MFERQHQVVVFVGVVVDQCDKAVAVTGALGAGDVDVFVFGQQGHGFGVEAVDCVHRARHQGLGARGGVADVAQFHTVKVAPAGFPVGAGFALGHHAHAGLPFHQGVGAGAVGFGEVRGAVGHDQQVVVRQHKGQVGIARLHVDLDLVRRELFDVGNRLQNAFGWRLGLAAVHIDGVDDVVGVQRLARGEGDALADVEDPFGGAGFGFPAFSQFGCGIAFGVNFDQLVPEHQAVGDRNGVGVGARIQAVRGRAAFHAHAQNSAFFGCALCSGRKCRQARRKAQRSGARDELSAVKRQ